MRVKVLQLNIEAGSQYEKLVEYLKNEDFDIVHLQEVCGGRMSRSVPDIFTSLKNELGVEGELAMSMHAPQDTTTYFGNATFYKKELKLLKKEIFWIHPFREVGDMDTDDFDFLRSLPRTCLSLQFDFSGTKYWFHNTHLAWGPTQEDEPHKIEQGKKLINYVSSQTPPFLLSGDFNVWKDSVVVRGLEEMSVNHATNASIINTLNPRLHRAKNLFPPGLAVDFLFTSKDVTSENFSLVDSPDVSDHFGLKIDIIV